MQLSKSGSAVVPIRAGCEGENPLSLTIQTGGPERDRTADLLLAKQALSQLSYRPKPWELPVKRFRSKSEMGWWAEQELHL